ncbi:TEA/ATTS domain family-domain-containing protein [Neohortaea acidophila]|uniref:TEA/ATTS domain family-domain-containing protein n=1 Tax=Neohortaea acidophila TaxID=245834 RepID=A0A6A6PUT4_9PEZI|nr:TEA/ATTS domain family-domain-containing protein [Neohortaea acidophila]KAF2483705.1 TEA/ATTS domain family-domain-containing protein [Neohortaea acidophila]
MIQPLRVLPSNAPPLREEAHIYQTSRVLQKQSGNRQLGDYTYGEEIKVKNHLAIFDENQASAAHHQALHTLPLYHPQPQHRQVWRYGHAQPAYQYAYPHPEEEERIRIEAERLYDRLLKTDAFVNYRNRQAKSAKGTEEKKWPDHLERAFVRALVQYPPMGRRQQLLRGKQRGRNELIADCIEQWTGEVRGRKQVSSHIQVLKPFVESDPYIMKWLAKGGGAARQNGRASPYNSARRMSNYPVASLPQQGSSNGLPGGPREDIRSLRKVKRQLSVFQPTDFQMFVQQHVDGDEGQDVERLHTYTTCSHPPFGPELHPADMQTFTHDFPLLASMHAHRPLDCNVISAEASLAFPLDNWKQMDGSPLRGVELGIYFLCVSNHLPPTATIPLSGSQRTDQIRVHNAFYENGVCVKEHSGPSEARLELSERGDCVETRIKFGSTFWAKTLGRLAGRLQEEGKDNSGEVAAYLGSINAVQEVVAWSEHGPERLLVIHWTFRHSSSTCGQTRWRQVFVPTEEQAASTAQDMLPMKRNDSMCGYTTGGGVSEEEEESETQQLHDIASQPVLQSPFEYESQASALSSATWPTTSFAEANMMPGSTQQSNDNEFDFEAGNLHLTIDHSENYHSFDSSAFTFDSTTAGMPADFAADPVMAGYEDSWYHAAYPDAFDTQQVMAGTEAFATEATGLGLHADATMYDDYSGQYEQPRAFMLAHHAQAFEDAGGGGQEMGEEGGDGLAALADASSHMMHASSEHL